MRIANYEVEDQTAYDNGEQWSHSVCQRDRFPLLVGICNAGRKHGDGQYRAENARHDLGLSAMSTLGVDDRERRTLFLTRRTSGSQEY
jgi:hypothetical protein